MFQIKVMSTSHEIDLRWMQRMTIGSGNGLMPSGNKPLSEAESTKI